MGSQSNIQWCDITWNIAVGCTKVDQDCLACYMYRDSLKGTRYNPRVVRKTKTVFNLPNKIKPAPSKVWGGRQLVFTSSLTDWAHPEIDSFRGEVFEIIRNNPHLIFQMLTKRTERFNEVLPPDWGDGYENVWIGGSCGSDNSRHRIVEVINAPKAKLKFLSLEPLWGPVNLHGLLTGEIGWVIVGGESGNDSGPYKYRPCRLEWIEDVVNQCYKAGIPVFVKQLGTYLAKEMGLKDRHGGDINEWPEWLKIRQMPISTEPK